MADCVVCTAQDVTVEDRPVTTFQYVRIGSVSNAEEPARYVGLAHTAEEIQASAEGMMGPIRLLWHAPAMAQVGVTKFHPDGLTGLQAINVETVDEIAAALRAARWPTR